MHNAPVIESAIIIPSNTCGVIIMSTKLARRSIKINEITIDYLLTADMIDGAKIYSIEIRRTDGVDVTSCTLRDVARSEEKAAKLLALLAENSVCPTSAPYVIDSLADSITFY